MTDDLATSVIPSPLPATDPTRALHSAVSASLSWADTGAFEDVQRGRIASIDPPIILNAAGDPVWDLTTFDFVNSGPAPDTVHPSLWRMAQLNCHHGLFKVTDRVYQVRGYDAANMTVIVGDSGFILVDPLTCVETADAALQLARESLGDRPVTAVIHTHCHIDHFGGVKGVVSEEDVRSGKVPLVAPEGFYEHAVKENISAGIAMGRRAGYMFGGRLPRNGCGHVTIGQGVGVATGTSTLIQPSHEIKGTGEELELDGVRFVFQMVPGTEAPAEMNFHLPQFRALCMAETISHNMHNLYTLRGAPIRDALAWSAAIEEALRIFGADTDVMFICHHWPVWGPDRVHQMLSMHRDLYRYIHDETLRLVNHGHTPSEIAEHLTLPPELESFWANRGCYGSTKHNAKAVYQRYIGWFDGNPANLDPLPPADAGHRYVALFGGPASALEHARRAHANGEYRWAAEILKHVLAAEPDYREARFLQADTFEQMGYQSESGPWRNFYLVGAQELRHGFNGGRSFSNTSPDLIAGMSTEMIIDYLAIRLNGPRASAITLRIRLDVLSPSGVEAIDSRTLVVGRGILRYTWPDGAEPVALRITRSALAELAHGFTDIETALAAGTASIEGRRADLDQFLALLDVFTGEYNVVTPILR